MKQFFCLLFAIILFGCSLETNPIKSSLRKDDFLKEIIKDKEEYQIQILLTKINQNNTQFDFNEYEYQLDDNQYFYPASTNKLPIVILTLKKINELRNEVVILKKSLMNFKFQKSTGQLEKTSQIKNTRIKIARLKTQMSKINGESNA